MNESAPPFHGDFFNDSINTTHNTTNGPVWDNDLKVWVSKPTPPDLPDDIPEPEVDAVYYCEEHFPNTTAEFLNIQAEMYETFCRKQMNYGPGNISVGTALKTDEDIKLSLTGLWFRMNDKVQRLLQLVVKGQPDQVGEAIQDTFEDLSVYGIIAQIVQREKWGK